MSYKFANICVDISHEKVDRPFQYKIPPHLRDALKPGMQVMIPFGKGNKTIRGFILELTDLSEYPVERCKEIIDVAGTGIPAEGRMIELAAWMKKNYGSTLISSLKTVLPVKDKVRQIEQKDILLAATADEYQEALRTAREKHHVAKVRLLEAFADVDCLGYEFVTGKLNVSAQTIKALEKQNVIRIEKRTEYRNPIKIKADRLQKAVLNQGQQEIADAFSKDYNDGIRKVYLLRGVTGSGKTEVYMEMIDTVLSKGRQVIVLIPEIALTYQTVLRFYKRFGDCVSVIHSKLSKGERYDQFERAKKGQIKIMIGPRSALFAPFPDLGLIVIDEEHENSYKSDSMPKYHAREVAEHIASVAEASVVLGSATPSVTSFYRAMNGEYGYFYLENRYNSRKLPTVYTVDLREELKKGNRSIFSGLLYQKMQERLLKGQQIMLFLNRRGYTSFLSCRSCGQVLKCPHCDVSLTMHGNRKMVCHYCGYETPAVKICPHCGSRHIAGFKAGTEQVENNIRNMFPKARILRMDRDTTQKKDDYEKILSTFAAGEADILIGTQMIVKGHDFPMVTLVGVLAADLSLGGGDYQAGERTFELLTQAVGRAGRGELPGEAVIQTYQPEHYAIVDAASQDYDSFYKNEIAYRQLCNYPPIRHMLAVLFTSDRQELATQASNQTAELLKESNDTGCQIIGPADAGIRKINDVYRRMLYVRHEQYEELIKVKDLIENFMEQKKKELARCSIYFDFDPMNGY